jgi:uncharacterized protein
MAEIIQKDDWNLKAEIIDQLENRYPMNEIIEGYDILNELAETYGLFSNKSIQSRLSPVSKDECEEKLLNGIQGMTLEVTEACNLRCRYCVFSGGYTGIREHGARHMSWPIAKAAIDFFHGKNKNDTDERPAIGFYGGEPLLNFKLIRKCVDYINSLHWSCPESIHWSVTTNGTMLNDKVIDFLVEHQFAVSISIDGPPSEHDRNRIFADGRPTFTHILNNLHRLRERSQREYYENHVMATCVFAPDTDMIAVNDFFVTHQDLFSDVIVSSVQKGHATFFDDLRSDPKARKLQMEKLLGRYLHKHISASGFDIRDPDLIFIQSLFERDFLMIHRRIIEDKVPISVEVSPACFAGKRKLFVDAQGALHICERVDRTYPIGDVWSGFDIERVVTIINQYQEVVNSENCLRCWAFRFCRLCYAQLLRDGEVSQEAMGKECESIRQNTLFNLKCYCSIIDENPEAFRYMEELVIM